MIHSEILKAEDVFNELILKFLKEQEASTNFYIKATVDCYRMKLIIHNFVIGFTIMTDKEKAKISRKFCKDHQRFVDFILGKYGIYDGMFTIYSCQKGSSLICKYEIDNSIKIDVSSFNYEKTFAQKLEWEMNGQ